jgi:hypothetical protein
METTLTSDNAAKPTEGSVPETKVDNAPSSLLDGVPETETKTEGGEKPKSEADAQYELKAPEGMDPNVVGFYGKLAKEAGLDQAKAQKLLSDIAPKLSEIATERAEREKVERAERLADETRKDPEIGGAKLQETISNARIALDRIGSPKFLEKLRQAGLDNDRDVIAALAKLGQPFREDVKLVTGNRDNSDLGDPAVNFYNAMGKPAKV